MPAILSKSAESRWINNSITETDALDLLKPSPAGMLKAHTISPLINSRSMDRNTPEVIKPYLYESGNLLF
jgi:putative SOS response-associated peptidase YedK